MGQLRAALEMSVTGEGGGGLGFVSLFIREACLSCEYCKPAFTQQTDRSAAVWVTQCGHHLFILPSFFMENCRLKASFFHELLACFRYCNV